MITARSCCRTGLVVLTMIAHSRITGTRMPRRPRRSHSADTRSHSVSTARDGRPPVIVSSGDGGWIHLGPHVAEVLASAGFFVVGFDVKAYLESFTSGNVTLRPEDEPRDFKVLADFAARLSTQKPILIGVSEGAGLSVLAATDPETKRSIAGVLGLGLPDINELGWRWRDSLIYVTHGVPNEPTFSTAAIVRRVGPVPLGAIHSTRDEFVPLSEIQQGVRRRQRAEEAVDREGVRSPVQRQPARSSIGGCSRRWPGSRSTPRAEVSSCPNGCVRRSPSRSGCCCSSSRSRCFASSCGR